MTTEEILKFGEEVFNSKEKFERWLDKSNIYLGDRRPRFLLLSEKGSKEVLNCLNRIEYGNLA